MLESIKIYGSRFFALFQSEDHLEDLEFEYRKLVFESDLTLLRIVMLIFISIIMTYGFIDYRVFGLTTSFILIMVMRIIFISITIMLMLSLGAIDNYQERDRYIIIWSLCVIVLALWVNLLRPKDFMYNAPIDLIIIFCFYVVVPNRYIYRMISAIGLTCVELYIFLFYRDLIEEVGLYSIVVSLIITNILGIIIANRLYTYRRKLFLSRHEEYLIRIELERLAHTDFLTGVSNRRYFFELAEKLFTRFQRYQHPWCLIMLDLDHFKSVNDTFGHAVGDEVLKCMCATIQAQFGEDLVLGRLGGEEFGVFGDQLDSEAGLKLAHAILTSCRASAVQYAEHTISYTLSIGVAQICPDDLSFDVLYQRADKALYLAKANGRNRVELLNTC